MLYKTAVTDYCGNYVYENQRSLAVGKSNGKFSRILFDGGFSSDMKQRRKRYMRQWRLMATAIRL